MRTKARSRRGVKPYYCDRRREEQGRATDEALLATSVTALKVIPSVVFYSTLVLVHSDALV